MYITFVLSKKQIHLLVALITVISAILASAYFSSSNTAHHENPEENNTYVDTEVGRLDADFFKMTHEENMWEGVNVAYGPNQTVEFEGIPGEDNRYDNVTWQYKTNSFGLRDSPIKEEKPELRVLILGNSHTLGQSVEYGERYSDILGEKLNEDFEGDVEVINAGIDLAGMIDHYIFVTSIGMELNPDVVIIGDIAPGTDISRAENKKMTKKVEDRSNGENTSASLINRVTSEIGNKYQESRNLWSKDGDILNYLDKTYKHLEKQDKELIISCSRVCHSNIHSWSENKGTELVGYPTQFRENNSHIYRYGDGHLNSKGHSVVAENIYRTINWDQIYEKYNN